jgi:hypothetical protein
MSRSLAASIRARLKNHADAAKQDPPEAERP